MRLQSLKSTHDLLDIMQHVKVAGNVMSCTSGFGESWDNLLAYEPCDQFALFDMEQITELTEFINRHSDKLVFGSFSYDLGLCLQGIKSKFIQQSPLVSLCAYDRFLMENNEGLYGFNFTQADLDGLLLPPEPSHISKPKIEWNECISMPEYLLGFDKIQDYIRAGDIYQINYTHQLSGTTPNSGRELFSYFMREKPVSHAAYYSISDTEIISLSPEGFITIEDNMIVTQPIKGTRPRSNDEVEDLRLREELITSEKEQAELFMIVDLLRNDLGKVCKTGSVRVVNPKIVTAMPNVWHTHATIKGQLGRQRSDIESLLSMFPGGSITGCPKHRAMEIIDELETESRGSYTGSIGYILPTGKMAFNIAIRTMVKNNDSFKLGVGGGITIKSDGIDEYHETAAKAAFFRV